MADDTKSGYRFCIYCNSCGWSKNITDLSTENQLCPNCNIGLRYKILASPTPKYNINNKYEDTIIEPHKKNTENTPQIIFETKTANGVLRVIDEGPIRSLSLDEVGYSCIYKSPDAIEQPIYRLVQNLLTIYAKYFKLHRVAILGGGCCTIPRFLLKRFPNKKIIIDSVEIEDIINNICSEYFLNSLSHENINIITSDAIEYITQSDRKYDFIFVDIFKGKSAPPEIGNKDFLQTIQQHLTPYGIAVYNCCFSTTESCDSIKHKAWNIFKEVRLINNGKEFYLILSNTLLSSEIISNLYHLKST